jgi:hypothetical protein
MIENYGRAGPRRDGSDSIPAQVPFVVRTGGLSILRQRPYETEAVLQQALATHPELIAAQRSHRDRDPSRQLVNMIGTYPGTALLDIADGSNTPARTVAASGAWTIKVTRIGSAHMLGASARGTSDAVLIYKGAGGVATFTGRGRGNFVVHVYSDAGKDLLVNEIGAYEGEQVMPAGQAVLQLNADGPWGVSITAQ